MILICRLSLKVERHGELGALAADWQDDEKG
jgi:hypothetical protein